MHMMLLRAMGVLLIAATTLAQSAPPVPRAELAPSGTLRAGINYNNVWAARGVPIDVTKGQARWGEPTDFHIVGSDASGIVYAVGSEVTNVKVGDEVVVHAGQWDPADPWVLAGNDPGLAPSFRVWGYDTCWGSFAQFTKVQAHQCLPKADHLTWEEAAAPTLTGGSPPYTASPANDYYRINNGRGQGFQNYPSPFNGATSGSAGNNSSGGSGGSGGTGGGGSGATAKAVTNSDVTPVLPQAGSGTRSG